VSSATVILRRLGSLSDTPDCSTITNFTAGGLSFDADHVFMNWQGVSHTPNDVLILNLQFGEVPEPATLALLGLGLAGIGFSRRKQ